MQWIAADDQRAVVAIVDLGSRIDAQHLEDGGGQVFGLDRFFSRKLGSLIRLCRTRILP